MLQSAASRTILVPDRLDVPDQVTPFGRAFRPKWIIERLSAKDDGLAPAYRVSLRGPLVKRDGEPYAAGLGSCEVADGSELRHLIAPALLGRRRLTGTATRVLWGDELALAITGERP